MKNIWRGILSVIGIFTILIVLSVLVMSNEAPTNDEMVKKLDVNVDTSYLKWIKEKYNVYSLPIPKDINLAGERVPIEMVDIRERIDKELLVNAYWQSHTILYHKRAHRWFKVISPILERNNIPDDFKYLALIESGFENVVSPAGAAGFWQFMPATAKSYDLEITKNIDERYNVEKATIAACEYLKGAYKTLGSWTLAAASYNCGVGGVLKVIRKQKVNDYYDMYLNNETSRYIPRIVTVKYILQNSENLGFNIRPKDLYPLIQTYDVKVDSTIQDLSEFAISKGFNYKILKYLNPWLMSNELPVSDNKTYTIKLPTKGQNLESFLAPSNVEPKEPISDTVEIKRDTLSQKL